MEVDLQNKKVTIIGTKKSGVAAASLLLSLNAIPFVSEIESGEKDRKSTRLNSSHRT